MDSHKMRNVNQISPDPAALKALTHPIRLSILGLLRVDGPATASGLAVQLGLNSGATSYHLRQLAAHDYIEEDTSRGNQRDRWWKARHETTSFTFNSADGSVAEAGIAFGQAALNWQTHQMQQALLGYADLPESWQKASTISDFTIPMTASGATALVKKLEAILAEAMASAPALGEPLPVDMQPFSIILHAAPYTRGSEPAK